MSGLEDRIAAVLSELDDAPARRPISAPIDRAADAAISAAWGPAVGEVGGVIGAAIGGPAGALAGVAAGYALAGLYAAFYDPSKTARAALDGLITFTEGSYKAARRFFGLGPKKKPSPAPTLEQQAAQLADDLDALAPTPTLPLSPALLAHLYGPAAASWNATALYGLFLRFHAAHRWTADYAQTSPPFRLAHVVKRVGDYLAFAPSTLPVEHWPLYPDALPPAAPTLPQPSRRALKRISLGQLIEFLTEEAP